MQRPHQRVQQESKQNSMQTSIDWMLNHANEIKPLVDSNLVVNTIQNSDLQKQQQYQNDNYYMNMFTQRDSNQIRNRYLSRLNINQNIQQTHKKNQHIFIFDWDDTLLCTTYVMSTQFVQLSLQAKALLQKLDATVVKLLNRTLKTDSQIYIITNASKDWIEHSGRIYMPSTHNLLGKSRIKVISARNEFSGQYPGDYARWKIQAFKSILKVINKHLLTNLICIGDSSIQMQAAHCLNKEFTISLVKTIKFRESPKPDELIKQLDLVNGRFQDIFDSSKSLTIRLQKKKNQ